MADQETLGGDFPDPLDRAVVSFTGKDMWLDLNEDLDAEKTVKFAVEGTIKEVGERVTPDGVVHFAKVKIIDTSRVRILEE